MGFEETVGAEPRSRFPAAFVLGLIVVALVFGGFVLLLHTTHRQAVTVATRPLPFGPAEKEYAARIHFTGIQMATANNMINQQFTYVAGTIENDGTQTIAGLEVSVEFSDPFKQAVLRETSRLIGSKDAPLPAGQHRDFQITLDEALPDTWDHQYPAIRVTGLVLQ
jgi:hypothetical protein